MLPARSRVHRSGEFRTVVRCGVRAGRPTVVVHAAMSELSTGSVDNSSPSALPPNEVTDVDPRVGFIVSKAVGNAVTRNRVKRRLRHLSRDLLRMTPDRTLLVVRALPGASARPERLVDDLGSAWSGALRKLDARSAGRHRFDARSALPHEFDVSGAIPHQGSRP